MPKTRRFAGFILEARLGGGREMTPGTVSPPDDPQRETAERVKREVDASGMYPSNAVTEIVPLGEFYPAEDYHQGFYAQNETYPYCQIIISPKLEKLYKRFGDLTA